MAVRLLVKPGLTAPLLSVNYLPSKKSINSARYTQRAIQTVKSRLSAVSEKVHRLDPPVITDYKFMNGVNGVVLSRPL